LEEKTYLNHNIIIENRKKFVFSGIKDIINFDEENILLDTSLGKLAVKGNNLQITNFNNENGDLNGEGRIHAVIYTAQDSGQGFFSKLFR